VVAFTPSGGAVSNSRRISTQQYASIAINGEASSTDESQPPPPPNVRLSIEEKAKTVISVCTSGTLCTTSSEQDMVGTPFGSYVDYVLDNDGNPILLMNEMSMHTLNIANNPEEMVTLFTQLGGQNSVGNAGQSQGQDVARCSITGLVDKVEDDEEDIDTIRMRYSIAHSYADQVMESPKFAFYRIQAKKVYYVGGFGVLAKWVPVEDFKGAGSDILAMEANDIVSRLNRDHMQDLRLTAEHLLECTNIQRVRATNVDRLGMDVRVTTTLRRNKLNTDEFRIGFRIPVISVEDAKSEVLKIFQEAWEKGNGYDWGDDEIPGNDVPIVKIAADNLG